MKKTIRDKAGRFASKRLKVYMDCKIHADPNDRWVLGRISTTRVDRDGDVILPQGMRKADFMRNPVVLFGHDASSLPIGKVIELTRRSDEIIARVSFNKRPEHHPSNLEWEPDTIHHLMKNGDLNGFSVGFTIPPGGIRPAHEKDRELYGKNVRQVITQWDLVELSVVPIPANQDALAIEVSKSWLPIDSRVRKMLHLSIWDSPRLVLDGGPRMRVPF